MITTSRLGSAPGLFLNSLLLQASSRLGTVPRVAWWPFHSKDLTWGWGCCLDSSVCPIFGVLMASLGRGQECCYTPHNAQGGPIGDLAMTENLGQIEAAAAEEYFVASSSAEQRSGQVWLLRLTCGSHTSSCVDGPA